jgi:diacylglycerol kinase (ATP)
VSKGICIIVNPAAGRGSAAAVSANAIGKFPQLDASNVFVTSARGDEVGLTDTALRCGYKTIIVVGGDGTCSRVAQTIIERGSDCRLAVIPSGTGNDFAKTLGVAHYGPEQIASLVAQNHGARIDVGRADGRYFINSCGFGFDASVLEATQRVRFLKGDALYVYSALAQLFSYQGLNVSIDGAFKANEKKLLMAVASNGRWLGGAFRIAPNATVTDGKLDFCLLGDNNLLGRIRIFAGALRGTHLGLPGVISVKAESLSLMFAGRPSMELDGELQRATSRTVRIECVPRALSVVAAPGALV